MIFHKITTILILILKAFLACILILFIIDTVSIPLLNHRRSFIEQQFSVSDLRDQKPYVMFKGKPFAESYPKFSKNTGVTKAYLNELGYPDAAPSMPKPHNEYRVIVLGGSSVFFGNPPIPRLIQYQFEKQGIDNIKVYNFGVISSVSSMELARLVFEILDYEPNLIISYSGFNDVDQPFIADPRPGYPYNYFINESNPILDSDIRSYPTIPLMLYGSNLMRYFFPNYFVKQFADLSTLRKNVNYSSVEWQKSIAQTYVKNLVKSKKIAQAYNAKFIAFFQPSLYFKEIIHENETKYLSQERIDNFQHIHSLILDEIEKVQPQDKFDFIDLSGLFNKNNDLVFKDRVHIYQTHRPYVAIQIYQHIVDNLSNQIFFISNRQ